MVLRVEIYQILYVQCKTSLSWHRVCAVAGVSDSFHCSALSSLRLNTIRTGCAQQTAADLFCVCQSFVYRPPFSNSSACVPRSAMRPCSSTRISSASMTVDSRWAIQMLVRPSVARSSACRICCQSHQVKSTMQPKIRFCWLTCSVIESKLLVASSNTRIGVFFRIARAIATRCFSPPDSFRPRSPTCVW